MQRTAVLERQNHLDIFVAISIALHALLFWAYLSPFLSSLELPSIRPTIEIVEVPRSYRRPTPATPAPPPPAPDEAPPAPETEAQPAPQPVPEPPSRAFDVVDTPKPAVEEIPRDARVLSRYNQRVERQARARDLPIDNRGEISKRKTADPLAKPSAVESEQRAAEAREAKQADAAQARAVAGGGDGGAAARKALRPGTPAPAEPPERVSADAIFRRKGAGEEGGAKGGKASPGEGIKDLLPTEERLAQLAADAKGGRSNPYNPDLVPVDAEMSMATLESEHVGYYLAIKKRIVINWDPARLVRSASDTYQQTLQNFGGGSMLSHSAGSSLAEAAARTGRGATVVRFVIAKNGRLEGEPALLQSSGSAFLDEEALRAVRYAEPFPPVPDRIAKNSLTITGEFIYGRR
ncbi:MAG: energy transducer TonB [Deltaproteobacteria bacterium]|nr:energy transducer TonB [Deltaproteobacteria bacterium]